MSSDSKPIRVYVKTKHVEPKPVRVYVKTETVHHGTVKPVYVKTCEARDASDPTPKG